MATVNSIVEGHSAEEPAAGAARGIYGGSLEVGVGEIRGSVFREGDSVGGRGNDGLADFEMNGVSSLLKMKESNSNQGGIVLDDGGIEENGGSLGDGDEESSSDMNPDGPFEDPSERQYSTGDFVWGKIKNHPWWPGRIHDPSDASEYAAKHRTGNNKTLVAYFGDGTFAWCHPTQLIPFEENFEAFSKQSTSRNFSNAVKAAVNEICGVLNSRMTCPCAANRSEVSAEGRRLATNSGIKEGIVVPNGGIEKLTVCRMGPFELMSNLRKMACAPSSSSMLFSAAVKNWLMAFYRMKGVSNLPAYYEPVPVPGLEDRGESVPFQGPVIEEWLSRVPREGMMRKFSGVSGDEASSRRKERSILEILGLNATADASGIAAVGVKRTGRKTKKDSAVAENGGSKIEAVPEAPVMSKAKVGVEEISRVRNEDEGKLDKGSYLQERKKSKRCQTRDKETEPLNVSGITRVREEMKRDDDHLMGTLPRFDTNVDDPVTKVSGNLDVAGDKTAKVELKTFANNVRNVIRDADLDPNRAKEAGTMSDDAEMFLPLYRTSVFRKRNRNHRATEDVAMKSDAKTRKKRATEDMTPETNATSKDKLLGKSSAKDDVGWLLIKFGQGCPLPTKKDLIVVYSKYGNLNENETVMHYNSKYALVIFKKISDAEEALKCSRVASPFGASGTEFELLCANSNPYGTGEQQPSVPRKRGRPRKVVAAAAEPSRVTGDDESEVQSMKRKIEKISSVLDKSGGKLSGKVKSHLEDDIKGLLALVSSRMGSTRSS